jgi:hypothetical protein
MPTPTLLAGEKERYTTAKMFYPRHTKASFGSKELGKKNIGNFK